MLDDADLKVAVEAAANSAFFSTGQRCTASSRIIVTEGIHDKFVAALTERVSNLKVGDALEKGTEIGPVVDPSAAQAGHRLYRDRQEGRRQAGRRRRTSSSCKTPGYYLQPTLFTEATNQMRISREEIFGPVASVIRVKDYEEALATANDTEFGLSRRHRHHQRSSMRRTSSATAEAGMVMVNVPTAGVDFHVPFGGRKGSSYRPAEQGKYAAEFFTTVKTAYTLA